MSETGPEPKTIHRRFAIALVKEALAGTGKLHLDYRVDRKPETIHVWEPRRSANDAAPPAPPDPDRGKRFGQEVLAAAMDHGGMAQVPVEIGGEPCFIDLYVEPARSGARGRGLLGRMVRARGMLSPMHTTPDEHDVHHDLFLTFTLWSARGRRNEGVPATWEIFTEGSGELTEGFGMTPKQGWPRGVYSGPPIYALNMVVLSELEATRETLLLRLMGIGATLERALEEQAKLPDDALERRAAQAALRAVFPGPDEPIPFANVPARDPVLRACRQIYRSWAKTAR
jgi:hypothetical protein